MKRFVTEKAKSCKYNPHRISHIRHFLTPVVTKVLVYAFKILCIDYARSLLLGVDMFLLKRLKIVQNNAASLIFWGWVYIHQDKGE